MNQMNLLPTNEEMNRAFWSSDATYDGIFFTGVRTTGIFCRPSCTAKKPHLENVEFFPTVGEAMFAGYRACMRCRPMESSGAPPDWVERLLELVRTTPGARIKDSVLRQNQIDPARARRWFQQNYGMTFQAYCRGTRLGKALEQLRKGSDIDDAALDSGYESFSGFREAFAQTFGTTPGRSQDTACLQISWVESPLGPLIAGATADGVCLLEFTDRRKLEEQMKTLRKRFELPTIPGENAHLRQLKRELDEYFAGRLQQFTTPLVYPGTPFQERVWSELLRIPYGETRSYEDIARTIENPGAVRAVGTANGCNRIAIVIPCHRVVNKGGKLGGYGGGLRRKQFLLDLEQGTRH